MLGRRVLPVRICTCPRRDLEQEEKNREKQLSKSSVLNVPQSPGPDPVGAKNGEKRKAFWILVKLDFFFSRQIKMFVQILKKSEIFPSNRNELF